MKYLFLLPLLLVSCKAPEAKPTIPVGLTDSPITSVVALVTRDGEAYCSGIMTWDGILTAAHCVEEEDEVLVGFYEGYDWDSSLWSDQVRLPVLRTNAELDLALIGSVPRQGGVVLGTQPQVGDTVFTISHPYGVGYVYHQYLVSGPIRHWDNQGWYLIQGGVLPGMSGGPVFNTDGELVGITVFYLSNPLLGGVVGTQSILDFLED